MAGTTYVSHPQNPAVVVEGAAWWVELTTDDGSTVHLAPDVLDLLSMRVDEPERCELGACENYADGRWCAEHASSRRP